LIVGWGWGIGDWGLGIGDLGDCSICKRDSDLPLKIPPYNSQAHLQHTDFRNRRLGTVRAGAVGMTPDELRNRFHRFSVRTVRFCLDLRQRPGLQNIADQLMSSATSESSNYRAACRARSHREFISKIGTCVEEADESVGWLQMIVDAGLSDGPEGSVLLAEARELTAIVGASRRTAESRYEKAPSRRHDPPADASR
jgi:four helix bundle protein